MDTAEHKKRCFARYVWPIRNDYAPNTVYDKAGKKYRETWAQCFQRHYKQSLEAYRAELNE